LDAKTHFIAECDYVAHVMSMPLQRLGSHLWSISMQEEVPECILHVNIPAVSLSEIPHGWSICLTDNPGFGEANEHIKQLASISVQDSSAYVYVTNSDNVGSERDFKFFKQLAEHDRGKVTIKYYSLIPRPPPRFYFATIGEVNQEKAW